jgi:hypothetical protein
MADEKGLAVFFGSVACIFIYGGLTGKSPLKAIQSIIQGKQPTTTTQGYPIEGATTSGTATSLTGSSGSGSSDGSLAPPAPTSAILSANVATGKLLAAKYGWSTGAQWNALYALWERESGWDNTIWNGGSHDDYLPAGSSGAYGIAQSLPYSKYPQAGWPPGYGGSASASAQISWGLEYIKDTYGTPEGAWAHETSIGWY